MSIIQKIGTGEVGTCYNFQASLMFQDISWDPVQHSAYIGWTHHSDVVRLSCKYEWIIESTIYISSNKIRAFICPLLKTWKTSIRWETSRQHLSAYMFQVPSPKKSRIWSHTVLTALMLWGWSCTQYHTKAPYAISCMCQASTLSFSFIYMHLGNRAQDLYFTRHSCFADNLKVKYYEKAKRSVTQHNVAGKREETRHTKDWNYEAFHGPISLLFYPPIPLIFFPSSNQM